MKEMSGNEEAPHEAGLGQDRKDAERQLVVFRRLYYFNLFNVALSACAVAFALSARGWF
ncbi:hypothetical protein [Paracoccus hibiscisoli]|uniref:hypothetical protein n=1 Tax=Paracoccus hibiscisoli TaxID=2023261 RepID=UPI0023EFEBAC|nr:hypothetical protein [Paracoccus hibiscisoli]